MTRDEAGAFWDALDAIEDRIGTVEDEFVDSNYICAPCGKCVGLDDHDAVCLGTQLREAMYTLTKLKDAICDRYSL